VGACGPPETPPACRARYTDAAQVTVPVDCTVSASHDNQSPRNPGGVFLAVALPGFQQQSEDFTIQAAPTVRSYGPADFRSYDFDFVSYDGAIELSATMGTDGVIRGEATLDLTSVEQLPSSLVATGFRVHGSADIQLLDAGGASGGSVHADF